MKKILFWIAFCTWAVLATLVVGYLSDIGKEVERGVVTEIGSTQDGGWLSDDCTAIRVVLDSGTTVYGTTYDPVSVGQYVYTIYWYEDDTKWYSTTFTRHKRTFLFR